jgi:hypothetical protein
MTHQTLYENMQTRSKNDCKACENECKGDLQCLKKLSKCNDCEFSVSSLTLKKNNMQPEFGTTPTISFNAKGMSMVDPNNSILFSNKSKIQSGYSYIRNNTTGMLTETNLDNAYPTTLSSY